MITLALLTKYLSTCLAPESGGPCRLLGPHARKCLLALKGQGKKNLQATRREARGAGVSEASAPAHAPAQKSPGTVGGEEGAGL